MFPIIVVVGLGWIDLTQPLTAVIPTWDDKPGFKLERTQDYPQGYRAHKIEGSEHMGTHVDAPAHFVKDGLTVDHIPVTDFVAQAAVVDVSEKAAANVEYELSVADLREWEKTNGKLPDHTLVIANMGWASRWGNSFRYRNADATGMHFPGFSVAAVQWLIKERPTFVGIGIDTMSVDRGQAKDFPVHKALHAAGRYCVENLGSLTMVPARGAEIVIAPLKIETGTGAPARILARTPDATAKKPAKKK